MGIAKTSGNYTVNYDVDVDQTSEVNQLSHHSLHEMFMLVHISEFTVM